MKELKEYTFDELVEKASANIIFALMKDGGNGFHKEVYHSLSTVLRWKEEQKETD